VGCLGSLLPHNLNKAVNRNKERFTEDFLIELSLEEFNAQRLADGIQKYVIDGLCKLL
jgi:hypothetical protein